jgi:hypothetical protein
MKAWMGRSTSLHQMVSCQCLTRLWGIPSHYPLNRVLGGPQSWSGHFGEQKNLLPLPGIEAQAIQPAAWLLYHLCCSTIYCINLSFKNFSRSWCAQSTKLLFHSIPQGLYCTRMGLWTGFVYKPYLDVETAKCSPWNFNGLYTTKQGNLMT